MTECIIRRDRFKKIKNKKIKIDNDSNETDPQLIGSLMYLVNTRLYSYHAVNVLIHFMSQPKQTH